MLYQATGWKVGAGAIHLPLNTWDEVKDWVQTCSVPEQYSSIMVRNVKTDKVVVEFNLWSL